MIFKTSRCTQIAAGIAATALAIRVKLHKAIVMQSNQCRPHRPPLQLRAHPVVQIEKKAAKR